MHDQNESSKRSAPYAKSFGDWIGFKQPPDWARARALGSFLGVAGVVIFVAASVLTIISVLRIAWISAFAPSDSGLTGIGAGALFLGILGTPLVVWRTLVAHRQVGFQKESLMTDRISKAVEGLGATRSVKRTVSGSDSAPTAMYEETEPNIEVRLGAILALERVSQDSVLYDAGRDHVRVMEILCAYVRNNAPASSAKENPNGRWEVKSGESLVTDGQARRNKFEAWCKSSREWASLLAPRTDIQVALRVVARRNSAQRKVEAAEKRDGRNDPIIDLRNCNLQGAYLANADFSDAILIGSRFEGAKLNYSNFGRSICIGCVFDFAVMGNMVASANFKDARINGSSLQCVLAPNIDLSGAILGQCDISGSQLGGAILDRANCISMQGEYAFLDHARLSLARLDLSKFVNCSLTAASFGTCAIGEVRFESCDLAGVDLSSCNTSTYSAGSLIPSGDQLFQPLFNRSITIQFENRATRLAGIGRDLETCRGDTNSQVPLGVNRPLTWN